MVSVEKILHTYQISSELGFLPFHTRCEKLSATFDDWEKIAKDLPNLINTCSLRKAVDSIPLIENPIYQNKAETERAMLLLSFIGNAYVFGWNKTEKTIPKNLAIPWIKTAEKLKRKPIVSHASCVLNNWYKLDTDLPFELNNLSTVIQFQGSIDESWFYLVTAKIEQRGGEAIEAAIEAILATSKNDDETVLYCLEKILNTLELILIDLVRIREFCDPYIFYQRVRPFLASFENVNFQGLNIEPQNFHGGSAAQSSLIQMFDAFFGIHHNNSFLLEMRNYMPPLHVDFLKFIQFKSNIKNYCHRTKPLNEVYMQCVSALKLFRMEHLKIVAEYILGQSKKTGPGDKGTGGTNPMFFLKEITKNTKQE